MFYFSFQRMLTQTVFISFKAQTSLHVTG